MILRRPRRFHCLLLSLALPATTLCSQTQMQSPSSSSTKHLKKPAASTESGIDNGTVANGVYRNKTLAFSCKIPAGWVLRTDEMNAREEKEEEEEKGRQGSVASSVSRQLRARAPKFFWPLSPVLRRPARRRERVDPHRCRECSIVPGIGRGGPIFLAAQRSREGPGLHRRTKIPTTLPSAQKRWSAETSTRTSAPASCANPRWPCSPTAMPSQSPSSAGPTTKWKTWSTA